MASRIQSNYTPATGLEPATVPQRERMVFIVNPKAGTRLQKRVHESIRKHLDTRRFEHDIWFTEKRGHASELAAKAVREGCRIVVAVGGDGSINEVASQLIHTDAILGIVPAGSGNGLAMHLGYGRNIAQAIQKLNTATPHRIDCGTLNGKYFFNLAGIGFDGLVSNLMNKRSQRGFIPYFTEAFRAGLIYQSQPCVLEINGETLEEKCFAVAVANGPMYGYNFLVAPGAELDDGQFSIVIMKHAPRWQYFAAVPSSLNGRFLEEPFVQHFKSGKLLVRCEGENYVHLDGEGLTMTDELLFEIVPNALTILAPASRLFHQ